MKTTDLKPSEWYKQMVLGFLNLLFYILAYILDSSVQATSFSSDFSFDTTKKIWTLQCESVRFCWRILDAFATVANIEKFELHDKLTAIDYYQ